MELTMSMFATPADYWKARAEAAEKVLSEIRRACSRRSERPENCTTSPIIEPVPVGRECLAHQALRLVIVKHIDENTLPPNAEAQPRFCRAGEDHEG